MHKYGIDNAIQAHLDGALAIPGLLAALICLGPRTRSGEFITQSSEATEGVLSTLKEVATRFQHQGKAENLEQASAYEGVMVISTFNGKTDNTPYIVAAVKECEAGNADALRKRLSAALYACVGESYSIKWK